MVYARVSAAVLAVLAMLAAFGWWSDPSAPHALGLLAAAFLAFVLSTIPVGRVP